MIRQHGEVYAREQLFDSTFASYVGDTLRQRATTLTDRERIWIAELDGQRIGCIAIVAQTPQVAQLRWYLVLPEARGKRVGSTLLFEAIGFARAMEYQSIVLWTVHQLTAAARLYRAAGFELVEATPAPRWGVKVIEEKYVLKLSTPMKAR